MAECGGCGWWGGRHEREEWSLYRLIEREGERQSCEMKLHKCPYCHLSNGTRVYKWKMVDLSFSNLIWSNWFLLIAIYIYIFWYNNWPYRWYMWYSIFQHYRLQHFFCLFLRIQKIHVALNWSTLSYDENFASGSKHMSQQISWGIIFFSLKFITPSPVSKPIPIKMTSLRLIHPIHAKRFVWREYNIPL